MRVSGLHLRVKWMSRDTRGGKRVRAEGQRAGALGVIYFCSLGRVVFLPYQACHRRVGREVVHWYRTTSNLDAQSGAVGGLFDLLVFCNTDMETMVKAVLTFKIISPGTVTKQDSPPRSHSPTKRISKQG